MWPIEVAWSADALGLGAVVSLFILSIRAIGGAVFIGACVWAGIRALSRHGLEAIFEVLIGLAIGAALIVGAPQIAAAAIGGAAGYSVLDSPQAWTWSDLVEDTLLHVSVLTLMVLPGIRLYWWLRRQGGAHE